MGIKRESGYVSLRWQRKQCRLVVEVNNTTLKAMTLKDKFTFVELIYTVSIYLYYIKNCTGFPYR